MSSNDKIKVKAIETSCILLGMCFLFASALLIFGYKIFEYKFNKILYYYLSIYFLLCIILFICVLFHDVKQIKFYKVFWFIFIFVWIFMILYYYIIDNNIKNIFLIINDIYVLSSCAIILINNFITRVFFWEGDNKNIQDVDAVSSEFAVDVLSIALFLGIILGLFAYLFFVPNQATPSFFGSIDIKTVALATAGLITFFWAAKAAKNKSIELEEKKQDGKRRDKEIKMAEARDTAQLIAKASELLGSGNDAQKYAGLAFLNTVAGQNGGPLQKEAFDLLADFILSATDTTTANKPRMRAIIYVDDLLEESCRNFRIDDVIVISASDGAEPNDAINDLNSLRIKNLYITYIGLTFYSQAIHWATHSKLRDQFGYVNCDLDGARFNEPPEIIKNISAIGCHINNFKIFLISKDLLVQIKNFSAGDIRWKSIELKTYLPKNEKCVNYFLECDFSSSKNWKYTRSNIEAGQEKDRFNRCFYYAGHPPYGFGEEGDDALLTEISSEQQFDELIDDPFLMKYSPPDDEKTSNE